jgi:putative transposase
VRLKRSSCITIKSPPKEGGDFMPNQLYKLSHCTYVCQYHIVWTVKYRGKVLSDTFIKLELKRIFKYVARWKSCQIKQWHVGDEHIHIFLVIPPKYSVSYIIQILKVKSSTWIKKRTKKFPPGSLWARGYYVSTLGINEYAVKNYIKYQDRYRTEQGRLPIEKWT